MADDSKATKYLNLRITQEQYDRVERLRERLQEKMGDTVKVTLKVAFLEALKQTEAYYDKLDRDKARGR